MTLMLAIFFLSHLALAIYAIIRVVKTNIFTKKQKVINIVLVVIVPLFWSVLMHYMLKKEPYSYEIEVKNDVSSNGFHESGLGAPGRGIGRR